MMFTVTDSRIAIPRTTASAALLAVLAGMGSAAQAQQSTDASAARAAADSTLERVVVTAGKRRQKHEDVAGSVTAIGGAALEANGVVDQEGIFRLTPGVQTNKGDPNQSLPTIRGVGTVLNSSALGFQQSTTGVYIEDVPFTDPTVFLVSADLAPFDLESMEILRGPQGALFGSSSLGGAVRYNVNKPDLRAKEFSLLTSVAGVSHGGVDASAYAMVNVPLAEDAAAVRIVAFDRQDSGWIRNIGTGKDRANDLHQRGGRILATFRPVPTTRITGMFMAQTSTTGDKFAVSPGPDQLQINTPTSSPRRSQFSLGNIQIESDIGTHTLTSNTGFVEKRSHDHTDETRRAGDLGTLFNLPALPVVKADNLANSRSFSQEFRIASSDKGALTYLGGIAYVRTTYSGGFNWNAPGGTALYGSDVLAKDVYLAETDRTLVEERALFGEAEYHFDPALSASFGGRYYHNDARYQSLAALLEPVLGVFTQDKRISQSGFTPKATVKYRFGDHMVYALASKGYRLGGVNIGDGTTYSSDSLWNYETGLRLAPSKGMQLDVSAFLIDWSNAQVNARQGGDVPLNGIANIGKARIPGAEVTVKWQATSDMNFGASAAYLHARTASSFTSKNGTVVASGTPLPGTPSFQASLQAVYQFAGPLETSGRFYAVQSFMGRRTLSIDSGGAAGAYSQFDARVAFSRKNWELGLFANNLGDRRGISGGAPVATFGGSSYTDYYLIKPRSIGVTLRYDL